MNKTISIPNFKDDFFDKEEWLKPGYIRASKICDPKEIEQYKQAFLDCWSWLEPKPRIKQIWLSQRMRNEELVENQEELINALREILEPIVDKIKETQNE